MSLYGTPPENHSAPQPAPTDGAPADATPGPVCSSCGHDALDEGFIEDNGEGSRGNARWIPGPLELGILGGARRMGKQRFQIRAFACRRCRHLDLFVGDVA
ncbi:hypothetical protein [Litorihabitans aurantiacus]|uniref:Uncharacterized protein n=1 Tax=Litorihabitans aurantiacus TaxID=1930061 RepID=A0AA37XFT3_9MICO|nr:hypothetical protein [Litorihabitans aurantiacus]GMA31955.1 hypothetical protein GCM10025875_19470 [Litorihabitans aurantiacus]